MSVAGKASVSRMARRAMYCAGPFADAANRSQAGDGFVDAAEGSEEVWIGDCRFGDCL